MEHAHERLVAARVAAPAADPAADPGRGPLVAAIVVFLVALPMTVAVLVQVYEPALDPTRVWWILTLVLVLHAAGLACQRLPRSAFAVGSAAMLGLAVIAAPGASSAALLPSAITFVLLEWQMGSTQRRGVAAAALGVGVVGAGIITTVDAAARGAHDPFLIAFEAVALVSVVAAGWALGVRARHRRAEAAALAERRVHDAVAAERTRIGRDLHDVVSHSLTVMIAQAEAARVHVHEPAASEALERVAETGRSAMQGLRGMLQVLDAGEDDPYRPPSPDLRGLARLVEQAGSPGHATTFTEIGAPRPLRPDAELALYRAAQEALTNAVRHVRPPMAVHVELTWGADEVVLTVTDDGGVGPFDDSGAARTGPGRGLIGMQERVRRAGGVVEVRRGRGWTVRVSMPSGEDG